MNTYPAIVASSRRNVLAEGPVWVAGTSTLLWVDIERGTVFEGRLVGDKVEETRVLHVGDLVGAAVPGADGCILVAAQERLVIVEPDGRRVEGPRTVPAGVRSRANDGAVDPAGRFLVGTLALDGRDEQERLLRLERDGTLTVIDADLALSNGIAWSPDGRLLYSIDTNPGVVWVRDYEADSGAIGHRRELLRIRDGYPDGMCVDARGYLWIAIWGAGEVRSFDPSGRPSDIVSVPARHPSSVAFVGERLDRMLITTASIDLTSDQLARFPDAGRLFLVDVGQTGVPSTPWIRAFGGAAR